MITLSNVLTKEPERMALAALMADFEREVPVVTLPTRIGDAPVQTFQLNIPGKPKAKAKPAKPAGPRKQRPSQIARQDRAKAIKALTEQGHTTDEIAELAPFEPKLTRKYVSKIITEFGLHCAGRRSLK